MKIEISKYYKDKGYNNAYLLVNKEPRRLVILKGEDKRLTISYAKYLYTSYYCCDLEKGIQVDHINGDKLDDRIENLQTISQKYNIQKDHKRKELIELECPVCHTKFLFEAKNLSTRPNPCCSRKCGGIKSHWK